MVGQRFIQLRKTIRSLRISALAASDRSRERVFKMRAHGGCRRDAAGVEMMTVRRAAALDCEFDLFEFAGDIARESEGAFVNAGFQ